MHAFKATLFGLCKNIFNRYCDTTVYLIKIKAVTVYVNTVKTARLAFIGVLMLQVCLLLMATGFILAHIAMFALLPFSLPAKAIAFLILSGVYFIVPLIIICMMCSERLWMKHSQASELVRRIVSEN